MTRLCWRTLRFPSFAVRHSGFWKYCQWAPQPSCTRFWREKTSFWTSGAPEPDLAPSQPGLVRPSCNDRPAPDSVVRVPGAPFPNPAATAHSQSRRHPLVSTARRAAVHPVPAAADRSSLDHHPPWGLEDLEFPRSPKMKSPSSKNGQCPRSLPRVPQFKWLVKG